MTVMNIYEPNNCIRLYRGITELELLQIRFKELFQALMSLANKGQRFM